MPTRKDIDIQNLKLDLRNFRTVPQDDEIQALHAMIFISPDRFWALMESIIDDGYLPTDNILVLDNGSVLVVREGNRRIAALKLIYGYIPGNTVSIPRHLTAKIAEISESWKETNCRVPCTIFGSSEEVLVDRIVTLTHGKGEKASRDQWQAVARARHNRDVQNANEPALDLLEAYLRRANNFTTDQAERWAGIYPISVLEDAMKRLAPRLGLATSIELAKQYPNIAYCNAVDDIIKAIGEEVLDFKKVRNSSRDFAGPYGIPPLDSKGQGTAGGGENTSGSSTAGSTSSATGTNGGADVSTPGTAAGSNATGSAAGSSAASGAPGGTTGSSTASGTTGSGPASGTTGNGADGSKTNAVSTKDPRAVKRTLRTFKPKGNNRRKVVDLRDEALYIDIRRSPLAFCFLLRSMFEVSAKAFCDDQANMPGAPKAVKATGEDRRLVDVLRDIYDYLVKPSSPAGKADQATKKLLHGAIVELARDEGLLSVTSMNQLIHSPTFSTTEKDICVMFGNIFPFLEIINR